MNVVIPMAGRGSRFDHPDGTPKPLVQIAGRPMLLWALESLREVERTSTIFVALAEHEVRYRISALLEEWAAGRPWELVTIPEVTEGQLCTVLEARARLDPNSGLLIGSCDTYVRSDLGRHILERGPQCAGIISVAEAPGDRWSFARTDEQGRVVEVAEKVRISPWASTGLYHFSDTRAFLAEADAQIAEGGRAQGEYYVIPLYDRFIREGATVLTSEATALWDLGTPESASRFETAIRDGAILGEHGDA